MLTFIKSLRDRFVQSQGRSRARRNLPRRMKFHRSRFERLEERSVFNASFDSVFQIGGDTPSALPWDHAVDAAGNTYVGGLLYEAMDFDPAAVHADNSDILTPRGDSDAFIAKYAADNSLLWARRMGSDDPDLDVTDPFESAKSLAVDVSGNVYLTGECVGSADFGQFTLTSAGSADAFVTKLDASGNFVWANRWGNSTREFGRGIALDVSGNVLAVG